ncbi:ATP:cob(I)alamin adenosyltransferase PduO-type [Trinorchestia longiramus]|nr:ATP:cob(I)alamin adenosyltransferase PduO-type [Trinorchestia longiramus]
MGDLFVIYLLEEKTDIPYRKWKVNVQGQVRTVPDCRPAAGVVLSFEKKSSSCPEQLALHPSSRLTSKSNVILSAGGFLPHDILIKRGVKIYTRTGDRGTSSTFTGSRHAKDHDIFEALGTIDELSAQLGLAREISEECKHKYCEELERIQCLLQDAATTVAQAQPLPAGGLSPDEISEDRSTPLRSSGVTPDHVQELEAWIDKYTQNLPPLTNFILPGGGRASAGLHVARTVCRRAERRVVALIPHFALDHNVVKYINRLSDYLFTIARYATIADHCKEVIYINPNKPKKPAISAESQTLSDA